MSRKELLRNKKGWKNFGSFCMHLEGFQVCAALNSLATSHGKGPCDGIGGSVKKLATKASLRRPLRGKIIWPYHFFCGPRMSCITLFRFAFSKSQRHFPKHFRGNLEVLGVQNYHHFKSFSSTDVRASLRWTSA